MIILDTNVISALMRITPEGAVIRWLDRQPALSVWTTAVTVFEIRAGLANLPAGRKRTQLQRDFEDALVDIDERILPFDTFAAEAATGLDSERRHAGRQFEVRDTMIAGIAIAHRATLATRNTRHFDDLPVPVVDPWAD